MSAATLSDERRQEELIAMAPSRRLGRAGDLAGTAVMLAPDDAEYCMGGFYMVDDGLMAV